MVNYWATAIVIFLCILSIIQYSDNTQLKLLIDRYLIRILPIIIQEQEQESVPDPMDVVNELEEASDLIYDFVIRNQNIFSNITVKNGCTSQKRTYSE